MIDCHAHLACKEFSQDLPEVLENAKKVGVKACIVVPEFQSDFSRVIEICKRFDVLFPCLGLHPVQGLGDNCRSVKLEDFFDAYPIIEQHAADLVAIGEVGLDFTPFFCRQPGDKDSQRAVLAKFVELSRRWNLPLNVHSRSAGRPTIELLKANGAERVLMHAFDGNPKVALQGVAAGYYFSIPPSIVRSEQKNRLVEKLPLENILLETDSPALGPDREARNVPGNLPVSCEYIANVKGLDIETVARVTTENARRLFQKLK